MLYVYVCVQSQLGGKHSPPQVIERFSSCLARCVETTFHLQSECQIENEAGSWTIDVESTLMWIWQNLPIGQRPRLSLLYSQRQILVARVRVDDKATD